MSADCGIKKFSKCECRSAKIFAHIDIWTWFSSPMFSDTIITYSHTIMSASFRQIFMLNLVKSPCNTIVFLRTFSLSA
jgi:hypothetical protein